MDNQHSGETRAGGRAPSVPDPVTGTTQVRRRRPLTLSRLALNIALVAPILALILWLLFLPGSRDHATSDGQSGGQSLALETAFDHLAVSGRVGQTPVVTLKKPISLAGAKERVYEEGTGRIIEHGQPVLLAITAYDGNTGELLNPSGRPKLQVGFATEEHFENALLTSIIGHSEGSRIVMVRRLRADKLAPGATSEFEIDVVDILPSIATGAPQPEANGRPLTVDIGDNGPRVTHSGLPPSNLTTQVLLKGDGAQVEMTDKIVAQFIMARWRDGVVQQSTWDAGIPQLIDLPTAMPGFVQALTDQRIGSRIAITIPPELSTGEDTMTVVVDILGAAPGQRQAPKNVESTQSGVPTSDAPPSGQQSGASQSFH